MSRRRRRGPDPKPSRTASWRSRHRRPARGLARRPADPDPARAHPGTERNPLVRAELDPNGEQVWFRIAEEAIGRMPEKTPTDDSWSTPSSSGSRRTASLSPASTRLEARVSEAGDTWIERLRW